MRQGAQGWCTGMTLRDGMGRDMGGRFRMGNTCTPMADSCQCMAKPLQYYKIISLQLNKLIFFKKVGGFTDVAVVKSPLANAGDPRDMSSIPGLERSPEEGYGNPLQYSCLEDPLDRGAWQTTVYGVKHD